MEEPNILFDLAARVINHTGRSLFLTGRAGTGKTTFLRHIQKTTAKKTVVVAPTGVAAINAGGVTMHSFFQLPLGMYIADAPHFYGDEYSGQLVVNRHALFKNMRMNRDKVDLLRELELVIIDEVSMLRADALDAIDAVLRHYRRTPHTPFGGVQMLFIGDLFQLPPVIADGASQLFYEHYRSAFFFDANVMREERPLVIELKHIYRQRDEQFIRILNSIRNNMLGEEDLAILHQRFQPWHQPEEGVIFLTTHNYKADALNVQRLESLPDKLYSFEATMKGEFHERAAPADRMLHLKVGAQVMFIKNESGETRRYYNGKLARVYHIGNDGDIWVKLAGSNEELKLEHFTWKSIKYKYNAEKDDLEEEELGSFTQYPVRLAWAITIHKSQGLTFERAIVDAGKSFAAGQVYVALSRLTSLDGMVLHSRIPEHGIDMPEVVIDFCRQQLQEESLQQLVGQEEHAFARRQLMQWFTFSGFVAGWQKFHEGFPARGIPAGELAAEWSNAVMYRLGELESVAQNFRKQMESLLVVRPDYVAVRERIVAAENWFASSLDAVVMNPLMEHYKVWGARPKTKKYLAELKGLEAAANILRRGWQQAQALADGLARGIAPRDIELRTVPMAESRLVEVKNDIPPQKISGETFRISLAMYQAGKSIPEIAAERGLVASTIEGHLVRFIGSGEVKLEDLISAEKLAVVRAALQKAPDTSLSVIKERVPGNIGYAMLRFVAESMAVEKGVNKIIG